MAGDKGYSSPAARQRLERRGLTPVIPTESNEPRDLSFDREAYRQRNKVERSINRLKRFRRIAARCEKRATNHLAMLTIGMSLLRL